MVGIRQEEMSVSLLNGLVLSVGPGGSMCGICWMMDFRDALVAQRGGMKGNIKLECYVILIAAYAGCARESRALEGHPLVANSSQKCVCLLHCMTKQGYVLLTRRWTRPGQLSLCGCSSKASIFQRNGSLHCVGSKAICARCFERCSASFVTRAVQHFARLSDSIRLPGLQVLLEQCHALGLSVTRYRSTIPAASLATSSSASDVSKAGKGMQKASKMLNSFAVRMGSMAQGMIVNGGGPGPLGAAGKRGQLDRGALDGVASSLLQKAKGIAVERVWVVIFTFIICVTHVGITQWLRRETAQFLGVTWNVCMIASQA
jgi:hypothetical protein